MPLEDNMVLFVLGIVLELLGGLVVIAANSHHWPGTVVYDILGIAAVCAGGAMIVTELWLNRPKRILDAHWRNGR